MSFGVIPCANKRTVCIYGTRPYSGPALRHLPLSTKIVVLGVKSGGRYPGTGNLERISSDLVRRAVLKAGNEHLSESVIGKK